MSKKIIFENSTWLVYVPETFETAHELYGKARWCVTHSQSYYDRYEKHCDAGYFIINKIDFHKSHGLAIFKDKKDYELVDVDCYRKYPFNIPNGRNIPQPHLKKPVVPMYILRMLFKLSNIKPTLTWKG